jgi:hypothetical protein
MIAIRSFKQGKMLGISPFFDKKIGEKAVRHYLPFRLGGTNDFFISGVAVAFAAGIRLRQRERQAREGGNDGNRNQGQDY